MNRFKKGIIIKGKQSLLLVLTYTMLTSFVLINPTTAFAASKVFFSKKTTYLVKVETTSLKAKGTTNVKDTKKSDYELALDGKLDTFSDSVVNSDFADSITYGGETYRVTLRYHNGSAEKYVPVFFRNNGSLIEKESLYKDLYKIYLLICLKDNYESMVKKYNKFFEIDATNNTLAQVSIDGTYGIFCDVILKGGAIKDLAVPQGTDGAVFLAKAELFTFICEEENRLIEKASKYYDDIAFTDKNIVYRGNSKSIDTKLLNVMTSTHELPQFVSFLSNTRFGVDISKEADTLTGTFHTIESELARIIKQNFNMKVFFDEKFFDTDPYALAIYSRDTLADEVESTEEYNAFVKNTKKEATERYTRITDVIADYASSYTKKIVESVKLNKTATSIGINDSVQLKATLLPANKYNKQKQDYVIWSSSSTDIAVVSKQGIVRGKKKGTVTIEARAKDDRSKIATCKVTVLSKYMEEFNKLDKKCSKYYTNSYNTLDMREACGKEMTAKEKFLKDILKKVYKKLTGKKLASLKKEQKSWEMQREKAVNKTYTDYVKENGEGTSVVLEMNGTHMSFTDKRIKALINKYLD